MTWLNDATWGAVAAAVGVAVLTAYAASSIASRAIARLLDGFGAPAGDGAASPWRRPLRVTRVVVFFVVLVAVGLPALNVVGTNVPAPTSRGALVAWLAGSGLRIMVVGLLTYLLVRAIATSTSRLESRVLSGGGPDRIEHIKRARTLGRLMKNALTALVLGVATLTILRELNVDVMPVLTGAGIVGLAVGFGAQTLVKDLISGFFIILDDNVRVGDVASINNTGGLVEEINLRTIVLRDLQGTVHVFPNGSITSLSNMTKDFAYAVVEVPFAYGEDVDRVIDVIRSTANDVAADEAIARNVLAPPELHAVEAWANGQMIVRVRIKARPLTQWDMGRELRRRIKKAFDTHGIEMPDPRVRLPRGTLPVGEPPADEARDAEPTDGSAPAPR